MDCWTMVARKKLAALIRRDDFLAILAINNESALLEFTKQGCRVTGLGKVTWFDKTK